MTKTSSSTPIALFCFNRPEHTQRTLEALIRCEYSNHHPLFVFIDGPRNMRDEPLVESVASLFVDLPFSHINVTRSKHNRGLYTSITDGISATLREWNRVVVIEDDMVVHPSFLRYMTDALDRYQNDPRVGCIHGYSLPIPNLPDYYFLRGGDCWGWATWRDRWALFREDPYAMIDELMRKGCLDEYMDTQGVQSLTMLRNRAREKNASWAILWHASLWLSDRLTLHPGKSFVSNIGIDGSGTHSQPNQSLVPKMIDQYSGIPSLPKLVEHRSAASAISAHLDGGTPLVRRLRRELAKLQVRLLLARRH